MEPVKLLLDTHALLWWWNDSSRLPPRVRARVADPAVEIIVSAASAWEIATKYRIGTLPAGGRIIAQWEERLQRDRFTQLAISASHALKAGSMPGAHRDPFDRVLAAQSLLEGVPCASGDEALELLGAERVW